MNRALPLLFTALLALCLAGCEADSPQEQDTQEEAQQVEYREPGSGQVIPLGSSGYSLDIPREYGKADPTGEYLQLASYSRDDATCINIYQWISSKGLEPMVESLMETEHEGCVAEMCKADGLKYACLVNRESYRRQDCRTVSFLFKVDGAFTEVEFTFDRSYPHAEKAAKAVFERLADDESAVNGTTAKLGSSKLYLDLPQGYTQVKKPAKDKQIAGISSPAGDVVVEAYAWSEKRSLGGAAEALRTKLIGMDLSPSEPAKATLCGLPCQLVELSMPEENAPDHAGMQCRIYLFQKGSDFTALAVLHDPQAASEADKLMSTLKTARSSSQRVQIADSPYSFRCSTAVSFCDDPNAVGKEGLSSSFFDPHTFTACNIYANPVTQQTDSLEHYAAWAKANVEGYDEEHLIEINGLSMLKYRFTETIGETAFNSLGYLFVENGTAYLMAFRYEGDDFSCQTYAENLTNTIAKSYTS